MLLPLFFNSIVLLKSFTTIRTHFLQADYINFEINLQSISHFLNPQSLLY